MHGKNTRSPARRGRATNFALAGLVAAALAACSASPHGFDGTGGSPDSSGGSGGGEGGTGTASGTASGGSSGGSASGSGGSTSGSGSGASGSSSGAGAGSADGGASGADAGGGSTAAYPPGPYGRAVGDTMANASFMGYRDGTGPWTQIQLSDYYDPDGTRGIRALYVTLGEVGCGACVGEAPDINAWKTQYAPYGTSFLSALWRGEMQNPDGSWSATQATVDAWVSEFSITYDIVADPQIELNGGVEPQANPNGYLVDPRTMKIAYYYPGAPGSLIGLVPLLQQNGATGL